MLNIVVSMFTSVSTILLLDFLIVLTI